MKARLFICLFIGGMAAWLCACLPGAATDDTIPAEALFAFEIQPLLEAKCLSCHGHAPDDLEGGLDLRTPAGVMAGGDSGRPALVPHQPENSLLLEAMYYRNPDLQMPPKATERLSEAELELVHRWIQQGAPWPDSARRAALLAEGNWSYGDRVPVPNSGGLSEVWTNRRYDQADLWAFLPLADPTPPDRDAHPIDAFLAARLQEAGLPPAPPADKRTLIRRATFDLTGLPPTPEEIEAFLHDEAPDAFHRLIDRLLSSPHYGEQWARHWLDVVRYADSGGFSNDYIRPNAWRYRDYVIRSFNEDKPYDRFLAEQVAGDELDPKDPEMRVAVGFLRMGPWEHTGMSVAAETRQLFLDDVTNSLGETFLSIPLSCAKCHDHKYDPIPTRDYYRVQAVFSTIQLAERPAAFLPEENIRLLPGQQARIKRWIADTGRGQAAMRKKEEAAAQQWFRERGHPYIPKQARRRLPDEQQPPRYYGLTDADLGYRKVLQKRLQILRLTEQRFQPLAFSVYNGPVRTSHSGRPQRMPEQLEGPLPQTHILAGGSVYAPTEPVSPGVLSSVSALRAGPDAASAPGEEHLIPETMDGRRTALARWLTDPEHPLVTRSIVNRVWQYHFGKGIAANANNFGATGKKPTHPELLDWLARYFVREGWSVKALHRLIMTSTAYQRSSHHPDPEKVQRLDPGNDYLAYFEPRRLAAEEIRDAMLLISGELNPEIGGLPIRPEINQEAAMQPRHTMGSIAQAYQASRTPEERNRRSIYAERLRTLADPLMEVFNQPATEGSCEQRRTSNVTPQAFSLFNGQPVRDRALAFGRRLATEAGTPEEAIRRGIERAWNRPATPEEIQESQAFIEEMLAYHRSHPPVPQPYPTSVRRRMFEEMTGEPFEFNEALDIYQAYIPDLKPWTTDPATRALGDWALVLFNANEFLYVY